jgi:hypothetical protein
MAGEADQNPPVTTEPTAGDNKSDSLATSSTTLDAIKMADNQIPEIAYYWKNSVSLRLIAKLIMISAGCRAI